MPKLDIAHLIGRIDQLERGDVLEARSTRSTRWYRRWNRKTITPEQSESSPCIWMLTSMLKKAPRNRVLAVNAVGK